MALHERGAVLDPSLLRTMPGNLAALRLQVETALAGRVAAPFSYRDRKLVEMVSAGIPEIDALTGGLPRGGLTEICGPPCSGRTSLLVSALASRTAQAEVCALVDGRDAFDPHGAAAAGVELKQLLWVRCRNIEQALRSTDLLLQGGGFGMIAVDLTRYSASYGALRSAECVVSLSASGGRYADDSDAARAGGECENVRVAGFAGWI